MNQKLIITKGTGVKHHWYKTPKWIAWLVPVLFRVDRLIGMFKR